MTESRYKSSFEARRLACFFLLSILVFFNGCRDADDGTCCVPAASNVISNPPTPPNLVTLNELRASLPSPGCVVGFDIDDTALFSTPTFDDAVKRHGGQFPAETDSNWKEFWNEVNLDAKSVRKRSAEAVIHMHRERGDILVFISKRPNSDPQGSSRTSQKLQELYGLDPANARVICTNNQTKTEFLKAEKVKVYYGDSDFDIASAMEAHAMPVRIMRSVKSSNPPKDVHNGAFGERVLVDSEE